MIENLQTYSTPTSTKKLTESIFLTEADSLLIHKQ